MFRFGSAVAITLPSVAEYWKPSVLRMKKLSFGGRPIGPVVAGKRLAGEAVGQRAPAATARR